MLDIQGLSSAAKAPPNGAFRLRAAATLARQSRTVRFWGLLVVLSLALTALAACSGGSSGGAVVPDDVTTPDAGAPDTTPPQVGDTGREEPDDVKAVEDTFVEHPDCPWKEPCDDGDPCTYNDECGPDGVCRGIPYTCDDGVACTHNVCLGDGECAFPLYSGYCLIDDVCYRDGMEHPEKPCLECATPVATRSWTPNDHLSCEDDNPCAMDVHCRGGECVATLMECEDDNPCTDGACDPDTGECVFTNNSAPCDNGDPCTLGDFCDGGVCRPGPDTPDCDDGNPCTIDLCVPGLGCVSEPAEDGIPCDDGTVCTVDTKCIAGVCKGEPISCNDANPCTDNFCDPVEGCQTVFNNAPCDDLDPCSIGDYCEDGVCHPGPDRMACDPIEDQAIHGRNPQCVTGICMSEPVCLPSGECIPAGGCVYINNRSPCEDGNLCTSGSRCANGVCITGQDPVDCNDGNICTDNHCDPEVGCVATPVERACTNYDPCTVGDYCEDGVCVPGEMLDCDDGNPCTDAICLPGLGCRYTANSDPCETGNPCTVDDYCHFTHCRPGRMVDCDDGNVCTDNFCVPNIGCRHTYNDGAPCEYLGDLCTTGDYCEEGVCLPGDGILECDDGNICTDNHCDPGKGCIFLANSLPCDAGNLCTENDYCEGGVCQEGDWIQCPDLGPCTNEFCDPSVGCTATVVNAFECRPQFVITYPERGAMLYPPTDVEVRGYIVAPAGDIVHARLNGFPLDLDQDNNFTMTWPSEHGSNVLIGECSDIWGSRDRVVQSYLMASGYRPIIPEQPTDSMIDEAIQAYITPGFLNKIAEVIEYVVWSMDLHGMLPNPLVSGSAFPCSYRVRARAVHYSPPSLRLSPTAEGIRVRMEMDSLRIPISVSWCFNASGTVTVRDIYIDMMADISVGPDGLARVEINQVIAHFGRVDVSVDGALGFIINPIISMFSGRIKSMLEDTIHDQLAGPIAQGLEDTLNSLALNEEIEIPALLPGMEPTSLTVMTNLGSIDLATRGIRLGMKTAVVAPKGTPYEPLGSMMWDNCMEGDPPRLNFESYIDLQMGIFDDFLNQLMYAAYWAGLLEITIREEDLGDLELDMDDIPGGGLENLSLKVSAMLPPVITSCNPWEELRFQIGDLRVDAAFRMLSMDIEVELYMSLQALADLSLRRSAAGNEITISLEGFDYVEIEVARLNDELLGSESIIGDLLEGLLIPMIHEMASDMSFGFAIPMIDIADLMPDMGLGGSVQLRFDIKDFSRKAGYTMISGDLER